MKRKAWSTSTRRRIWEAFGRTCQMCRQPTDERGFDLDHHIPLEIGGDDEEANLRPLCRPCHRLKTAGDVTMIAKAKRREAIHTGAKQRTGFQTNRSGPFKKRMDGSVVRRDQP
jgi:5-methylcytosine-specific restriction protein A